MNYIAVKVDLVRSRRISDRYGVQERLFDLVDRVNRTFGSIIQADFVVTHGDEIQGLLHDGTAELLDVMELFVEEMKPHDLRFGIGRGTIATRLRRTAVGMDGPAWHLALDAIEQTKKELKIASFQGFGRRRDDMLRSLVNLLFWQRARWSAQQREVVLLAASDGSQKAIARRLGISQAAVSKRLRAAGWRYYEDARNTAKGLLSQTGKSAWD